MSSTTTKPRVSIIIPSLTGEASRSMQSMEQQTFYNCEVIVVQGVSPAARARNLGGHQAKGDILIFMDDDAVLGHEHILEKMVDVLENDAQIAVVGVSEQIPTTATRFQRAVSRQVPRISYPILADNVVSNPPLSHFGFTAITTLCCAVRRTVFQESKGFDESLTSGEDTDFFYRVHRLGYNLVVAGNCWVYHEPPTNVKNLMHRSFWYGIGHALEARKSPERGMAIIPMNRWYGQLGLIAAVLGFPFAFFVHYYFDPVRQIVFGFRPLKTLSTYASLCGYIYGWYHTKTLKAAASDESVDCDGMGSIKVQTK